MSKKIFKKYTKNYDFLSQIIMRDGFSERRIRYIG